jgi:hypothetical protein
MVGEKTVCVASPALMNHFITSLLEGPDSEFAHSFDTWSFLSREEVGSMLAFGMHAYSAKDTLEGFMGEDKRMAEELKKYRRKKRLHRHVEPKIQQYQQLSESVVANLNEQQIGMNRALGRRIFDGRLNISIIESEVGLKMPALLRTH